MSEFSVAQWSAVHGQLPYIFANGESITEISMPCIQCGKMRGGEDLKGSLCADFATFVVVEGAVICHECESITLHVVKYRDDGTFAVKMPRGTWNEVGVWGDRAKTGRPGFLKRAIQKILTTFR